MLEPGDSHSVATCAAHHQDRSKVSCCSLQCWKWSFEFRTHVKRVEEQSLSSLKWLNHVKPTGMAAPSNIICNANHSIHSEALLRSDLTHYSCKLDFSIARPSELKPSQRDGLWKDTQVVLQKEMSS